MTASLHALCLACGVTLSSAAQIALATDSISKSLEAKVAKRGQISGAANICGLDWKGRNFLPMMSDLRASGLDERQTAIVAALHGAAMRQSELSTRECDESRRLRIEREIDYRR
ncbi:hypothetical protein D1O30_08145 [Methylocystis hirsuta]|uniref:Uncharacterized protein n=1 Tax=Methylocystis hirsuta TaxID=369798 RepID=A0A3M9XP11_9HYPH|nr:hypothetical protein D1O30_08145 [Methylocystis hirsuta]